MEIIVFKKEILDLLCVTAGLVVMFLTFSKPRNVKVCQVKFVAYSINKILRWIIPLFFLYTHAQNSWHINYIHNNYTK